MGKFDLVVVGAGSGGVRAARMASQYGARVAIIEESRVGGTCVIRGCVPKKLFVYASHFPELFDVAGSFGWKVNAHFDWPTLKRNKDREIDRLEQAYEHNLSNAKVTLFRDRGEISGKQQVRLVNSKRVLEASHILIATGGWPHKPHIEGAELGITSNEVFEMEELPASILIEGGGYVAVEFAGIFAGLGVNTSLCYRREQILRGFDHDLRAGVEEGLTALGVDIRYSVNLAGLSKQDDQISVTFSDGTQSAFGKVLFATGRHPNVDGMGLTEAGVAFNGDGSIRVDDFGKTSVPGIYAVGDVSGGPALTPVAIRHGAALAETLFNDNPTKVDKAIVPTAVFTVPEVGTTGLSEEEAKARCDIDVYITRFRPMINSLSARDERIMMKLIVEAENGKVIGCHVYGPGSAELIQMVAIPMGMGATKDDFNRAIAVHPTASEELVTFKSPSYRWVKGERVD